MLTIHTQSAWRTRVKNIAPLRRGHTLRRGTLADGANPQDGLYQIALPIGDDYGFRASASGYLAISDRIDLRQATDQQRYERNLVLIPIATGVPIRLNNIFFDTAKTELLLESRAELDRLATLLRDLPAMRIEIRGHTDAVDDDATN